MSHSTRTHIALASADLAASVDFYTRLFGVEPVKRRHDYAKFELDDPGLLLALNAFDGETGQRTGPAHFGIQTLDAGTQRRLAEQARLAELVSMTEGKVTCCYAVSDKVWAVDPDGNKWEIFHTVADADVAMNGRPEERAAAKDGEEPCCAPTCCA